MSDQNELKTKAWNEAISPRLIPLRAWFNSPEWKEGVRQYLNFILEQKRDTLERPEAGPTDQFIKGQISAFKEVLALPLFIEKQIEITEKNKELVPKGDAGY